MEVDLTARQFAHVDQNTRSGRLYASTRRELIGRIGEPTSLQFTQIDVACRLVVAISELRADDPKYEARMGRLNRDLAAVNRYLFGPDGSKRQRRIRPLAEVIAEAEAKEVA
jgi:hypothetical protein